MSYIGGPLFSTQEEDKEREERSEKSINLVTQSIKSLLPDLTDPKETAEYFTDLTAEIAKPRVPAKSVAIFAGKRLLADLPAVRKAVNVGKEIITPVIQKTKTFLETDYLEPVYAGIEDLSGGMLARASRDGLENKPLVNNVFAFQRQPRTEAVKQQIIESLPFKPTTVKKNIWGNYIEKFGSNEGALAALKKAETSKAHLKTHGSLKGNNNLWTDPVSGEVFLVNNKTSRAAKLKGEITIGFDNVKNVERTLANRLAGAKLDTKKIEEIGKGLGWDDVKIQKYIETNEQAKRTLEALIRDLNKGEGRTMWSLGHRSAVKHLPHSADRALNIELEPLVDVLTKEGRTILGNTGRAANDELIDLFKKITNNPADLESDMIHWGDSLVGNFMPRMREINNADDFFKEIVKREDFLNNIKAHAKKNNLTLEQAADELMEPLMKKYPSETQPTYFD